MPEESKLIQPVLVTRDLGVWQQHQFNGELVSGLVGASPVNTVRILRRPNVTYSSVATAGGPSKKRRLALTRARR
jgi:hypothetical protein